MRAQSLGLAQRAYLPGDREAHKSPRRTDGCRSLSGHDASAVPFTVNGVAYYVVIFDQGPAWIDSLPMRAQQDWAGHAKFMNSLTADGFVVLGGPIGDGTRHGARLIVKSDTEQDVRERMTDDPWARLGLLVMESIEEWEVLLSSEPDD